MHPAGAALALALGAAQPDAAPATTPPAATQTQPPPSPLQPGAPGAPAPPQAGEDAPPPEPLADDAKGTTVDQAYASAEARQGALDGRWRLSDAAGVPLFDFQLTDPGEKPSPRTSDTARPQIEGAWRDLRREGALGGDGVVDQVVRDGDKLVISFHERDAAHPMQAILHAETNGGWIGELAEVGATTIVFLERP
ncbi:hypothetical protein [Phenylobacterium montanum]|uniref:Copper-binding protein n=1 Tax=Phenylobacterium montanum TaxID=2823693 RepID=A0A975FXS6_9CAUL|nr:hypothetical protein [Caulobacter sp. S6]QUD86798.1 hypothetical protein KCG34_17190 [Caulobacter sp. S6]